MSENVYIYVKQVYMIATQVIIALLVRLLWHNVQQARGARRQVFRLPRVRVSVLQVGYSKVHNFVYPYHTRY